MARKRAPSFRQAKPRYTKLLRGMRVKPGWTRYVSRDVKRIMRGKKRYQRMAKEMGIPWELIGLIHLMEGGCSFGKHMHCGTSLKRRTTLVPKGRPRTGRPPFTWEESCRDALGKAPHNLARIKSWPVERMLYELEKYNGFGYWLYHSSVPSPYIWSGTNRYKRGKYVRDGKWSSSAVSGQLGVAPILLKLLEGRRYEPREIVAASSKLRTTDKVQKTLVAGGGVAASVLSADTLGVVTEQVDTIKALFVDNQSLIIVGLVCAGLAYTWWIKHRSVEDHKSGRYQPSGLDDSIDDFDKYEVPGDAGGDDYSDLEDRSEDDYSKTGMDA